jgi:hypothetical protein
MGPGIVNQLKFVRPSTNMKVIIGIVLATALMLVVFAQKRADVSPIEMEGAPDLLALGVSLWQEDAPGSATFSIRIKNVGGKTIKAVNWEEELVVPAGKNKVTIKLDLGSNELYLRPGEEQLVLSVVDHVLDSSVAKKSPGKIQLTRVEYEGGSLWQRPVSEAK